MNIEQKIAELKWQLEELGKRQKQLSLLPDRMGFQEKYWTFGYDASDPVFEVQEDQSDFDDAKWDSGFYFQSEEQAMKYYKAFSTMLLMRRQPGIVTEGAGVLIKVTPTAVSYQSSLNVTSFYESSCMFPFFRNEDAAREGVAAVGEEHLIATATFLAGK